MSHDPISSAGCCDLDRRAALDQAGYAIFERLMSAELLAALRTRVAQLYADEGDRAGAEFKQERGAGRLANLAAKGEVFYPVIVCPEVLGCMAHVLGPRFKLSSLNARTALPGCEAQPLHADMGAIADDQGYWVCNSVWLLDDFTLDNGALRVVPGSHRWGRLPPRATSEGNTSDGNTSAAVDPGQLPFAETLVTASAGSVVVMNAHLWHGGSANKTPSPRSAIHAFYCRRDKPQQQYQKRLVPAGVQRALSPELRAMLALDDPLNDELASSSLPRSGFLV
jgi:ectoine hydroxylase-related dioxygenase (phytanoyl-CoA dioxygenase family)